MDIQGRTYTIVSIAAISSDIATMLSMDVMLATAVKAQVRIKNLSQPAIHLN